MTFSNNAKEKGEKSLPQYLATLSACIGMLAVGSSLGWTGNISEDLKQQSYNGIKIDDKALGWIASTMSLGMLCSGVPAVLMGNGMGRKVSLLVLALPIITGWLFIIFANSLWMMYVGRCIGGVANGAFVVICIFYISEIAKKEDRGRLCSFVELHTNLGALLANVIALFLSIKLYTIILSLLPIIFFILFMFQPESPVFYVIKDANDKAKKSILRLRGASYMIDKELDDIRLDVNNAKINKSTIIAALKQKGTRKAFFICTILRVSHQLVGGNAINAYTATIFQSTGLDLDEKISTVIVVAFQVIATFVSSILVDKLGRKVLLIVSNFGAGLSMVVLAIFLTLKDNNSIDSDTISKLMYLPVVCISIYYVSNAIGMGPIPLILAAELFVTEIKIIAFNVITVINFTVSFLLMKYYLDLKSSIGLDGTFYMFAAFSLLAMIFSYFFVLETKGKSFAQIQKEIND